MDVLEDIEELHRAACERGESSYVDPLTRYRVFTADALRRRQKCCGCGCRHCPYHHENVPPPRRAAVAKQVTFLAGEPPANRTTPIDLLFWSGGKDSLLAARALAREHAVDGAALILLTTFDAGSRRVAHQEVDIAQVVRQAEVLGLPLLGVPLWPHIAYEERLRDAFALLRGRGVEVRRICGGDLHLETVWRWRLDTVGPVADDVFGAGAVTLHAPLWEVPYESLLADLAASAVPCRICAIGVGFERMGASIGELFGPELLSKLSPSCDKMGEQGEFHTLAEVWAAPKDPLRDALVVST